MTQEQVNSAIKSFCNDFKENPYLHRCEHSLHISLYNKLMKVNCDKLSIKTDENFITNYIHKEFPGRKKEKGKTSSSNLVDRTQVDIAVLAENQQIDSLNDFLEGNLDIDYCFELSLEYGIEHLCWDIFKFITGSNKSIDHKNYIIHFYHKSRSRKYFEQSKVDNLLNDNTKGDNLNEIESCYYLVQLCINYAINKNQKIYEEILEIVINNVERKNQKYSKENYKYLYGDKDAKLILQNMKFILIDGNPKTQLKQLIKI
jgi:hypothetical protein